MMKSYVTYLRKIFRCFHLYGVKRTLFKLAGRVNSTTLISLLRFTIVFKRNRMVSVIGCGQFGFATIGAILSNNRIGILSAYDVKSDILRKFLKVYGANEILTKDASLDLMGKPKVVYIASNHASHAEYAGRLLNQGNDVYIEKPIAVNRSMSFIPVKNLLPSFLALKSITEFEDTFDREALRGLTS